MTGYCPVAGARAQAWGLAQNHQLRSDHIRSLVQHNPSQARSRAASTGVPRVLVQYWDDPDGPPEDVQECLNSWPPLLAKQGFSRLLFDDVSAQSFLDAVYGQDVVAAFGRCRHPAMRADLFRLGFLLEHGGVYVDADDVLVNADWHGGSEMPGLLGLQPLCYDNTTGEMVSADVFRRPDATSPEWIFYVNNNPLVSPPGHPLLRTALYRAVDQINRADEASQWDVQSTTGPGNLTACLVARSVELATVGVALDVTFLDWDTVAVSRWPLSYRGDARNWRCWDRMTVVSPRGNPTEALIHAATSDQPPDSGEAVAMVSEA